MILYKYIKMIPINNHTFPEEIQKLINKKYCNYLVTKYRQCLKSQNYKTDTKCDEMIKIMLLSCPQLKDKL